MAAAGLDVFDKPCKAPMSGSTRYRESWAPICRCRDQPRWHPDRGQAAAGLPSRARRRRPDRGARGGALGGEAGHPRLRARWCEPRFAGPARPDQSGGQRGRPCRVPGRDHRAAEPRLRTGRSLLQWLRGNRGTEPGAAADRRRPNALPTSCRRPGARHRSSAADAGAGSVHLRSGWSTTLLVPRAARVFAPSARTTSPAPVDPFPLAELLAVALERLLPHPPLTCDQVRLLKTDKLISGTEPSVSDLGITPRRSRPSCPNSTRDMRTERAPGECLHHPLACLRIRNPRPTLPFPVHNTYGE